MTEQYNAPVPHYSAQPPSVGCPLCGAPYFGVTPVCGNCGQVVGAPPGVRLSTVGKRFGGWILEIALSIVTLGIGYFIWSLIVWANGTTPGKQLLGMRVIRMDTRARAGWGRMFIREFLVSGLLIGFLSAITAGIGWIVAVCLIFGALRQTLWDLISGTTVVDDPDGRLR